MKTTIFVASHPKGRNRKLLRMGGWICWKEVQKHPIGSKSRYCVYIYIQTYTCETPSSNNFSWIWTWPSWSFLWQQKHVSCLCKTIDIFHYKVALWLGGHFNSQSPQPHIQTKSPLEEPQRPQPCCRLRRIRINPMLQTESASIEWIEQIHHVFFQCSGRFQIIPKLWRWK